MFICFMASYLWEISSFFLEEEVQMSTQFGLVRTEQITKKIGGVYLLELTRGRQHQFGKKHGIPV